MNLRVAAFALSIRIKKALVLSRFYTSGERLGRGIVTDAITTPVVNTSAYFFKKTADLIDFKEKRSVSFECGRYGNLTTVVAEEKISALEGAESTLTLASGMCAGTVMLFALVPAGGLIVTTTDCYRQTRIFIENFLPKMGITATVIDTADMGGLESALEKHNVSLFLTESPTNPFLRWLTSNWFQNFVTVKVPLSALMEHLRHLSTRRPLLLGLTWWFLQVVSVVLINWFQ